MLSSVEEINMFRILKRLLKKSDAENKSLSDEYLEIIKKFGELGIRIQDIETLEVSVWEIIYKSLVSLYKKYPEVSVGFIREINFNKVSNGVAMTYFPLVEPNCYDTTNGVFIALNRHYFLNVGKFKNILYKTGLPYEAGYEFSIAHEFGHIIEFHYCIKNKLIPFGASIPEDEYENILHQYDQYYHLKNNKKIMIYYIPKDIYNYIKYSNKNIVTNGIVPKEIEEKFNICCRWMNIEFNYLFDVKHYNCVGGKKLGLKPSLYNKDNPIIIIRKSSRDRISFKKTIVKY